MISKYGTPQKIYNLNKEELLNVPGVGEKLVENILESKIRNSIENHIKYMEKNNIDIISIDDADYPQILKEIYDYPISLYVKGNIKILNDEAVAIVGCRDVSEYGKKSAIETKDNIKETAEKIKTKLQDIKIKKTSTNLKGKNIKKTLKNTPKIMKRDYRVTKKLSQKSIKGAKKAYQIAKSRAKAMAKSAKQAMIATIRAIKAIILAAKSLIFFLFGGFWIAIIIIIVVSLIAMLVGSVFGIFFSSEDVGSTITINETQQPVTMNKIIADLNTEFMNKITQIQQENPYNEYDITGSRAEWKDILAVYVAKVSGGDNQVEMATLDDNKVNTLKEIFWAMNEISFTKEEESREEVIFHLTWTEYKTVTYTKLHITINTKSIDEMADNYNFTQEQRNQLTEMSDEKYASMWSAVIYGNSVGSNDIVEVAKSQIGNVGRTTILELVWL